MEVINATMVDIDELSNATMVGMDNVTNATEVNIDAYLYLRLGPRTLPLYWLIPITAIYSVIFFTGIVGNVCTCIVISRNQYMQTATNCYLFNLAIADMLTLLLAMPPEMYTFWNQYPWQLGRVGCWLRSMIPEATAYASILTIVTFSTERYVAICHPLHQQTRSKLSNAVRNIAIIWLSSAVCAFPFAFLSEVNHLTLPGSSEPLPQSAWCGLPFNQPQWTWEILMVCSTVIFFVIPVSVITALYVRIALALHQSRRLSTGTQKGPDREGAKARSRRVVIRMLAAVVIAFFVCWAPFHAQRLLFLYVTLYGEWTENLKSVNQTLFTMGGCFYYFNSTINPILYSVMSNRFRVAFREKLCAGPPSLWCICCCCFCCVKDFEKRSQQQQPSLPAQLCRNSASHSSVRSYISCKITNNNLTTTPQRPRSLAVVDYNPKLGSVSLSCVRYGNSLTVTPPRQDDEEDEDIAVELDEAIRLELDRLDAAADKGADCISCTNCSLLFPPRPKVYEAVEKTSTTDLSQTTDHNAEYDNVKESLV